MMAWMQYARTLCINKERAESPFAQRLTSYLENNAHVEYSEAVLRQTVKDVLALDEDLLKFVETFIMFDRMEADGLQCDHFFTMEEFLQKTDYTPVAAALLFQMYRWDKMQAFKALMMHDLIEANGDDLPEREQPVES